MNCHFIFIVAKKKHRVQPIRMRKARNREHLQSASLDVPERFDWRDKKVVSEVRSQGKCGACWAHSTVATIESMVAIQTGKLTEFSVQQLVDCSNEENQGCRGGDTCAALDWMVKNDVVLESARQYPNQNDAGNCLSKKGAAGVQIRSNYTCDRSVLGRTD